MKQRPSERGSALLLVTIVTLVIVGISGAYFSISWYNTKKSMMDVDGVKALYIAESAAALFVNSANTSGGLNAVDVPASLAGGTYSIPTSRTVNYSAEYFRFVSTGSVNGISRSVDVLLSRAAGGVWWNAVYAPNSSGGNYTLALGAGDIVNGDMYSGGGFSAAAGATMTGDNGSGLSTVTHKGDNTSSLSAIYKQGTQPDLVLTRDGAGQTIWEQKAEALRTGARTDGDGIKYIDVAYDLQTRGTAGMWGSGLGNGGMAEKQIAGASANLEPAHIFRMNPSSTSNAANNRTQTYEYTKKVKNDFYLEDPTASGVSNNTLGYSVNGDTKATSINIDSTGNNAVYFIDGNMRVSGEPIKTYQLTKGTGIVDLKMTFVVKGNVSLTDNMVYPDYQSKTDAVAIIAVTDPDFPNVSPDNFNATGSTALTAASGLTIDEFVKDYNDRTKAARDSGKIVPEFSSDVSSWSQAERERAAQEYNKAYGSGNVYFGDPGSGTVEHFESFMYAENNFYATNLNSTTASGGTQKVEIYGNMTAGNQVNIVRDTSTGYVPMRVTLDTKIKTGSPPPALPATPSFGTGAWFIAEWKQVPSY